MSDKKERILLFCPTFFGYEKRFEEAFRSKGFDVCLYDERPSNGFFGKTCLRLNFGFYKSVIKKYIKNIIEENKDKTFSYIVVVKSEAIGRNEVFELKNAFPTAKLILYLWDSVNNIPDGENKISLYDRVLTFDMSDSKKFGIPFLPIPYGKEYTRYDETNEYKYDVAFIGTAHSLRPRVVKQVKEQCEKMGRRCFTYFYSPHFLVFLLNKIINKDYKYISFKEVKFKPLSTEEVCRIYSASRCVLDIEHPKQSGTTTRPVEMLPMRKKIITTNIHVKDYDFYNENNFLVIDKYNPVVKEEFFKNTFIEVSMEIVEKYSPIIFAEKCLGE